MVAKIYIIQASDFIPENYSEVIRDKFTDEVYEGIEYKQIFTFEHHIHTNEGLFFDTQEDFQNWKNQHEYDYFILPLDLVPSIKHYASWVKETYPDKIFDVVLGADEIEVEGQMVSVPTNILKMIPCGITAFNPEGEMLLEAVIESWNTQVPSKAINFNVKFYSLSELTQFIESCTNSR